MMKKKAEKGLKRLNNKIRWANKQKNRKKLTKIIKLYKIQILKKEKLSIIININKKQNQQNNN